MSVRKLHRGVALGGRYLPHQFLIEFSKEIPFVSTERRPTKECFHLFAHEYWHYWHNLSTIAGVKQFFAGQHLLGLFSKTLMANGDGTSAGSDCLGAEQYRIAELLTIDDNVEGQVSPVEEWQEDVDLTFEVVAVRILDDYIEIDGQRAPTPTTQLDLAVTPGDGSRVATTLVLGGAAIEESVAILVEEHVASRTQDAILYAVPEFPYRVLERTLAHLIGRPLDPYFAAALGTLALVSTHPGPALVHLAELFRAGLQQFGSDALALSYVIETTAAERAEATVRVSSGLESLVAMHRSRGLLEGASRFLVDQTRAALDLRRRKPLLDLAFVFHERPIAGILAFQEFFPSCEVLQERDRADDGDYVPADPLFLRDALVLMNEAPPDLWGFRRFEYVRVFQAQQSYLQAHIDRENGVFFTSSETRPSRCPYFTTCELPLRASDPEVCGAQPWGAFDFEAPASCWYALAVAGALGPHEVPTRMPSIRTAPSHEEIAVAAYCRWLARGGRDAPEAALDDWLAAERDLAEQR